MTLERQNFILLLDSLNRGGGERVVADFASFLISKEVFVQMTVFSGLENYPIENSLSKKILLTKKNSFQILCELFLTNKTVVANFSKSVFLCFAAVFLRRISFQKKLKLFVIEHAVFEFHTGRKGIKRLFDLAYLYLFQRALRSNSICVVTTSIARSKELRLSYPNAHIFPWQLSLSSESFSEALKVRLTRSEHFLSKQKSSLMVIKLLVLARLTEVKRIHWCISAASFLARKFLNSQINLRICGEGEEQPYLQKLALQSEKLNKNLKITFTGFVTKWDELETSDILLVSSRTESFGLGILEALMCGVPVVCSHLKGGAEDMGMVFSHLFSLKEENSTEEEFTKLLTGVVEKFLDLSLEKQEIVDEWPKQNEMFERLFEYVTKKTNDRN